MIAKTLGAQFDDGYIFWLNIHVNLFSLKRKRGQENFTTINNRVFQPPLIHTIPFGGTETSQMILLMAFSEKKH